MEVEWSKKALSGVSYNDLLGIKEDLHDLVINKKNQRELLVEEILYLSGYLKRHEQIGYCRLLF